MRFLRLLIKFREQLKFNKIAKILKLKPIFLLKIAAKNGQVVAKTHPA